MTCWPRGERQSSRRLRDATASYSARQWSIRSMILSQRDSERRMVTPCSSQSLLVLVPLRSSTCLRVTPTSSVCVGRHLCNDREPSNQAIARSSRALCCQRQSRAGKCFSVAERSVSTASSSRRSPRAPQCSWRSLRPWRYSMPAEHQLMRRRGRCPDPSARRPSRHAPAV
jgi:hypothetical protein